MQENKKKESYYAKLRGFDRAVPIILLAVALFLGLCFILNDTGSFGQAISGILLGLFSYGAYAIPFLIALHALLYPSDTAKHRRISRVVFSAVALILISSSIYAFSHLEGELLFTPGEFYALGQVLSGGGFIGSIIGFGIIKAVGIVGFFIIAGAIIAIYLTYFIARNNGSVAKVFYGALSSVAGFFASAEDKIKKNKSARSAARAERLRKVDDERRRELYSDDYFAVDNGMQELSINELGIKEKHSRASVEMNPTLSETVHHKSAVTPDEASAASDDDIFFSDGTITVKMSDKAKHTEKKAPHLDYDIDAEDGSFAANEHNAARKSAAQSTAKIGIDEDAESVFTKDFDPFDFASGEKLASKPSSKVSEIAKSPVNEGAVVYEQSIDDISEEDVKKARRQADFELRKKMIIERENALRRAEEAKKVHPSDTESASASAQKTVYTEEKSAVYSEPVSCEPQKSQPDAKAYSEYSSYSYSNLKNAKPESAASAVTEEREETVSFQPHSHIEAAPASASRNEESDTVSVERSELKPTPDGETKDFSESCVFAFDDSPAEEMLEDIPEVLPLEDCNAPDEEEATLFDEPIPEKEQNPAVFEQRKMFSIFDDEPREESDYRSHTEGESYDDGLPDVTVSDYIDDEPIISEDYEIKDEPEESVGQFPPFEIERPGASMPVAVEKDEPKAPKKPDYSSYELPPIDLLGVEDNGGDEDTNYETAENANKLIETLASFNVTASIKGFDRGPRITRYEVVPARGVKVSSIMNLFDDIALNLAAEGIRMEAPIPGKSAVGVEIPNSKPYTVRLRSLLETEEFATSRSKTVVCMGKDVAGQPVFGDIAKMPHVLIAGATGMGKSVCINSLLLSMLYKAKPDEVKFIMIDPKKVEFNIYNGIPHLLIPVVTDPKQAAGALMWAVEQMEKRYDMIEAARVRNIEAYNAKVLENPELGEPMPKIVIVVDELADLMLQVKNPVEGLIMSIAQKARAAGIHLIIGTQRPSVDIITGVIKANIPSRISCKVMSNADSRTILDMAGAEKLLDKGDMLFNPAGASKPKRVQGAFVSDSEVESIIEFIKSQVSGNVYDDQALEEINRAAQKCSKEKGSGGGRGYDDGEESSDGGLYNNREFLDAVDVAVSSGKISTSLLQRKLSIGFGKAAKFIDGMEELGIVSGPNGQKPRDVLITKDEWHEKLSRVSLD